MKCGESNCSELRSIFVRHEIKYSRQREEIYHTLLNSNAPLTAEEIFLKIKKAEININLSTVYRVLEVFEAKDLVSKSIFFDEGKATFELKKNEHHHYLLCTKCKKMMLIEGCPLEGYEQTLAANTGFEIVGHRLEISGICPECK